MLEKCVGKYFLCWNFRVVMELVETGAWESMLERYVGNMSGVLERYVGNVDGVLESDGENRVKWHGGTKRVSRERLTRKQKLLIVRLARLCESFLKV